MNDQLYRSNISLLKEILSKRSPTYQRSFSLFLISYCKKFFAPGNSHGNNLKCLSLFFKNNTYFIVDFKKNKKNLTKC